MKSTMKWMALIGLSAATLTTAYLMDNKDARKKVGKKMIKTMNQAENTVAKTMY